MSFKEGQQFSLKEIDQPYESGVNFTKAIYRRFRRIMETYLKQRNARFVF